MITDWCKDCTDEKARQKAARAHLPDPGRILSNWAIKSLRIALGKATRCKKWERNRSEVSCGHFTISLDIYDRSMWFSRRPFLKAAAKQHKREVLKWRRQQKRKLETQRRAKAKKK